jgi:methanogenic corrinoid protein MtbC1
MTPNPQLAEKLRAAKASAAVTANDLFFAAHPDWLERYGERGRQLGLEDAMFHIDFLASAAQAGDPRLFYEYGRWVAGMLASRGIAPALVEENFRQIEQAFTAHLTEVEQRQNHLVVRAGREGCAAPPVEHTLEDQIRSGLHYIRQIFTKAILEGDRVSAHQAAMKGLRSGASIPDLYVDVFQEALYEVGRSWASNHITVAEEHRATAIVQFVLARIYPLIQSSTGRRGPAVITGVQHELHQVGANMIADVLESDGWDVQFLGTNMPHEGILKAIEEHQAALLGISATMLYNVPYVERLIRDVRHRFGAQGPRIVVGGGAFRSSQDLYRQVDADLFAPDVRSALDIVRN